MVTGDHSHVLMEGYFSLNVCINNNGTEACKRIMKISVSCSNKHLLLKNQRAESVTNNVLELAESIEI